MRVVGSFNELLETGNAGGSCNMSAFQSVSVENMPTGEKPVEDLSPVSFYDISLYIAQDRDGYDIVVTEPGSEGNPFFLEGYRSITREQADQFKNTHGFGKWKYGHGWFE